MMQKIKNPVVAVGMVSLYLWILIAVTLGFSEGYVAGSEAGIIETFSTASTEFIGERENAILVGGLIESVVWTVVGSTVILAFFLAEIVAIVTYRYLTWIPADVMNTFLGLFVIPPMAYIAWVVSKFVESCDWIPVGEVSE